MPFQPVFIAISLPLVLSCGVYDCWSCTGLLVSVTGIWNNIIRHLVNDGVLAVRSASYYLLWGGYPVLAIAFCGEATLSAFKGGYHILLSREAAMFAFKGGYHICLALGRQPIFAFCREATCIALVISHPICRSFFPLSFCLFISQ